MDLFLFPLLAVTIFVFGWCTFGFSLHHPLLLFKTPQYFKDKNILLLIAHPDDESMFFSPLLTYLCNPRSPMSDQTHILSLSNGGSGVRSDELRSAAKNVFSIWNQHIEVIDDVLRLKDSMSLHWDSKVIMEYVARYVSDHSIDVIFTFDSKGISGHPNHCSIYDALQSAVDSDTESVQNIDIFALKSTNIMRKYSAWLEPMIWMLVLVPLDWNISASDFVVLSAPMKCWEGMAEHNSQFVWFRKLFVIFSRYSWINEFKMLTTNIPSDQCKKRR